MIGGGLSTESLPRDVGIADGREGGVVHSGLPPGVVAAHQRHPHPCPRRTPMDQDIWEVVAKLHNGCAVGAMGMKVEHLKEWLHSIKREEAVASMEGAGDRWRLFVSLIQATWERRTVPTQMSWMVIVLLPKWGGGLPWYWFA